MIRSLTRPAFLCFTAAIFRSFSLHSTVRLRSAHLRGISGGRILTRLIIRSSMSSSSSSSSSSVLSNKQVEQADRLLAAKNDDHGGVIVEMSTEPVEVSVFVSLLRASILHWKQQGKKGVWIKLPIELVNLVEPAVKEGFHFHHAESKYLMLVNWIPDAKNTLPKNASHRVGVGAFVMNDNNEVLVVQEKSGILRGTGVWKFPTGVVDEGEDICDAAVREVKEETGIDTKFVEIVALRQSHKSFFEKSDLFFVCVLQPLSFDIHVQESELEAAQVNVVLNSAEWMAFDEYVAQPFVQKNDLMKYLVRVCSAKKDNKYSGFSPVPAVTSYSDKKCFVYLDKQALD